VFVNELSLDFFWNPFEPFSLEAKIGADTCVHKKHVLLLVYFVFLIYHIEGYINLYSPQLQCRKRKLKVSVVAVPKTIDNDILLMDKTFGFDTAVEEAQRAINSAYIEVG
jgi:6-phosphofructokinase